MAYRLGNGIWSGVFAVPNAVVDAHLKMASGLSVKVLLLLLRAEGQLEPSDMAARLGQSVTDIQDAVNYWVAAGVIDPQEQERPASADRVALTAAPLLRYTELPDPLPAVSASPAPLPEQPEPDEPRRLSTLGSNRRRMTTAEINELAEQDENIAYLLQETQAVLGKTLTPVSTDVVVALYSYYEMKPDLILMLIHYCVSIGKDSMRYIEKVAADWLDKGINTHEKAEAEILRLTRQNSVEGKVKAAFGIHDRHLVASEKKYIHTWLGEYRQDMALITLAFERTVETKGKLSFPYINGILTNWYKKGITTTAQAMQEFRENRENKSKYAGGKEGDGSSYDIGELENMITYGDIL